MADAGYSLASTLQFASQRNVGVLVGNYLGALSTVDGAATYLGLPARTDLHEDFHSATMRYNPGLEHCLSSEEIEEIKKSDEYVRYTRDISNLTQKISNSVEIDDIAALRTRRETSYRQRSGLLSKRLQENQQAQKLRYETKPRYEEKDWHQGHVDRVKHILPDARARLSHSMRMSTPPRSELWKQAIEDLIYLRNMDCNVAWQESLQPKDGRCPVSHCDVQIER